MISSR
jgi:hypothetical protein